MRARSAALFHVTGAVVIALARAGFAQQQSESEAELLFREGRALLQAGDYAKACPKLERSYRLDAASGTLLGLAICHEGEQKYATAWGEYQQVVQRARREGRSDRERAARARAAEIAPKISTLTLALAQSLANVSGLTITRNDMQVARREWGTPVRLDPGQYVFRATAPGKREWSATVVIESTGDHYEVLVPELPDVSAKGRQPKPANAERDPTASPAKRNPSSTHKEAGATLLQAGAVASVTAGGLAVGAGAIWGLMASSKKSQSDPGCAGTVCSSEMVGVRNDAIDLANRSTIAFVAGGTLLAGGVALHFWGKSRSASQPAASAPVSVGLRGLGLVVSVPNEF